MSEHRGGCAELEQVAVELATDALAGEERAAALHHLSRCEPCRQAVDHLARAAGAALLVAPPEEPPAGFESRVLARLGHGQLDGDGSPKRRASRPRRLALAVAAAAVVALAAGVATLVGHDGRGSAVTVRTALARPGDGQSVCRAVAVATSPTWLVVSIDQPGDESDHYTVEAVPEGGGPARPVGAIQLADGHGTLGAPVDLRARDLRSVRVVEDGAVRYEATFTT